MSLLEQQNFLARVFTEENLRLEFLSNPEEIGSANGLDENDICQLKEILPSQLNLFGDSLYFKRLGEVRKLLPLSNKALDKEFTNLFREFARDFLPKTTKKHLEDALEFADFLSKRELSEVWIKDVARFEQARLDFNANGKRFVLRKFDFDIREILAEFSNRNQETDVNFGKRTTFSVWFRFGGKTRQYFW